MDDLDGKTWLKGLAEPGAYDGKQYGIPYYAANRVVIYRTDLFKQAGIDASAIKTRGQWIAATKKLNSAGTQGIYLPGQSWYTLAGFVWDEGGDLATQSGGKWKGALDTPRRSPVCASTSSSRHSARAPRTPTRPTRRRQTSWPRGRSPRSSRLPVVPTSLSRTTLR